MRLQGIPARMIARLALALAPLAHILALLGPARRAMRALHVRDQRIVIDAVAEVAVAPQTLRLRVFAQAVLVV